MSVVTERWERLAAGRLAVAGRESGRVAAPVARLTVGVAGDRVGGGAGGEVDGGVGGRVVSKVGCEVK